MKFPSSYWKPARNIVGTISAIALPLSLWLGTKEIGQKFLPTDSIKVAQAVVLGFWVLVPPIWFWCEYFFFYATDLQPLDEFKHGQDQAAKIWVALIALLYGMYFGIHA